MPRQRPIVTYRNADPDLLPTQLVQPALILSDLDDRGTIDAIADRIRIRRQGGFAGVDVFLLLLVFLAAGAHGGLRPFWSVLGPFSRRVAALARRSNLPSPAAASRALGRVEHDLIRPHISWLLTEAPQVDAVLNHPAVLHYDALGRGWHTFDLDPTVTTLRQRALPVGDDLPEAIRRAENTGKPGHSGRKRGDIQYRSVEVDHTGAGVAVHAHLHQGNGDGVEDLELPVQSVVALCERMGWPLVRVLFRADGEFGTVPYFHVFRKYGLPFVTRANYPSLYDNPNVLDRLREATWYHVPDSGSGPQRVAADLGVLELRANRNTRKADGSPYAPVQVRIVASAFETDGSAQRGRKLDGWQVELFAADVPSDAWPAPEVVATYYGRACQENRFAQEDREVGLDRIISYDLPGQELATLVGLFLMNYRIARGFELERPPAVRPAPSLRVPVVETRMPKGWPRDPVVAKTLRKLDWDGILSRRPGWTWDETRGELRCDQGRLLELTSVRPGPSSKKRTSITFRRPRKGCRDCESRPGCLKTADENTSKQLELAIDTALAKVLRKRLERVRKKPKTARGAVPEPISDVPGLHSVIAPRFLPREARKVFEELFVGASVRVVVDKPAPRPPRLRLVASDDAERQARRQTWEQRVARYALHEDATVELDVATDREIRRWLHGTRPREANEGAAS